MGKDVVEVVRCKDCIYKADGEDENEIYCEQHHAYFRKSDFCNYGRYRDDVENNLLSKMTESNARWIDNTEEDDAGCWECSKCGQRWFLFGGTPNELKMNYCPNCGAKMDLEEDERCKI